MILHSRTQGDAPTSRAVGAHSIAETGVTERAISNALSVDVEDYFQVSAFEGVIPRDEWSQRSLRVADNTYRLLQLFDDYGVKATFFTLGWVAERAPELVRAIAEEGHEVASHGYDHTRVTKMDAATFKEDVIRTKQTLEDTSGAAVTGYRAPTFSIDRSTPWALPILSETGHRYSSSVYPVKHDLYGSVGEERFPYHEAQSGLLEIPISTVELFGRKVPCGGGGYFRLYPYAFTRWCFRRINHHEARAAVFYMHPWEIDSEQPRLNGISMKTRFRHYVNLKNTERRLRRLLAEFKWGRMDEIFLGGST